MNHVLFCVENLRFAQTVFTKNAATYQSATVKDVMSVLLQRFCFFLFAWDWRSFWETC